MADRELTPRESARLKALEGVCGALGLLENSDRTAILCGLLEQELEAGRADRVVFNNFLMRIAQIRL